MQNNIFFNTSTQRFLAEKHYIAKYCANKIYYNLSHTFEPKDKETVIVYQMGKVGSTTILKSLQALKSFDVYHVHALTKDGIKNVEKMYKRRFYRTHNIYEHLLESQYLRKQLDKGLEGKNKWKVVTLVRDPIAKNISSFFQHLESRLGYEYKNKLDLMKMEDIIKELMELFLNRINGYNKSLTWFERELNPVFGIDIYSKDFPKSKGYEIYEAESANVLIIRLENLNERASDAFKTFLNINEFTLLESNTGNNKGYSNIYQKFLKHIVLPENYINEIYSSNYVRHFYSEEEIEALNKKWRKQTCC